MVLVPVGESVGQDDIGSQGGLELLEGLLDLQGLPRKETVAELEKAQLWALLARQEACGGRAGLLLAHRVTGEYGPMEARSGVLSSPANQCRSAADLDVVAVRAEAKHGGRATEGPELQRKH